ncbi:MAG TPA: alpha/beta hydrolase [Acidimicrobiales bacterium]|nr:alpha/beta hydrolase [Acidimicrobiales bacterium]
MITRTVNANDVELAVVEQGMGNADRLLLVHGFGGSKEDFTHYLPRLGALGWHAVAPDLRGHGDSSKPDDEEAYSLAQLADDLRALLDALGWDDAVVLGHSMGGMVVQVFSLGHPGRVRSLILMDTSHKLPDHVDPSMVAAGQAVVREGGTDLLVSIGEGAIEPGPLDTQPYLDMCAADPAYKAWSDFKTRNTAGPAWAALAGDMAVQEDRLEKLRSLTMPTLVVVGEMDHGFLPQSVAMSEAIPGAQLAVIPGGGHSPQFEAPTAWWDAVRAFLDASR